MKNSKTPIIPVVIGTGFGAGFFPWGPGTAGALLATLMWWGGSVLLGAECLVLAVSLLIIVFTAAGIWAANRLEPFWGEDPSRVVVDEMVGVWIPLLVCPAGNYWYVLAAFLLFRLFDIVKPFGVRHMEQMKGGVGVMMDDILAGLYAMVLVYITRFAVLPLCDF